MAFAIEAEIGLRIDVVRPVTLLAISDGRVVFDGRAGRVIVGIVIRCVVIGVAVWIAVITVAECEAWTPPSAMMAPAPIAVPVTVPVAVPVIVGPAAIDIGGGDVRARTRASTEL